MTRLALVSPPRAASPGEYAAAAEEIDTRLRELPGLVAILALGSVSAPGISDLDRVAVLAGEGDLPAFWEGLSERARYVAMHTPFAVDAETFRCHRRFAYLEPLEPVWGEAPEREPAPEGAPAVIAAESLVLNLLRSVKTLHTGRVKVRAALCELHSVRHGLRLAGLGEDAAPRAWALAHEVAELRAGWFETAESARAERLRAAVASAPAALAEALAALDERLDPGATTPPLPLAGPWSNVTLTPTPHVDSPPKRRPYVDSPPKRRSYVDSPVKGTLGRRVAEARWRARARRVEVPAGVLALLGGAHDPDSHAERSAIVRRYAAWAAAHAPGYSTIGMATTFMRP